MKRIISTMLLIVVATSSYACDLCGCSSNSQYLGILPQFYKQFIGIQYQYNSFFASQPALLRDDPNEEAVEYNNTFQVWGRYNLNKRIQLFAFVPFHDNMSNENGTVTHVTGIGDMSILGNVVLLKKDKKNASWHHVLLAGGGIKLPTGKYTGITTLDQQGLPNIQAGTGSWDFITNVNYTIRHKNFGANLDAAYTFTTVNKDHYKYGNHLNTSLLGFYWWQVKKVAILPQAGIRYEYSLHDYDNYERKWLNEGSGGTLMFATIGVQSYYKRFGAKVAYDIPVSQHYGDGYVTAHPRLQTGVFFLF